MPYTCIKYEVEVLSLIFFAFLQGEDFRQREVRFDLLFYVSSSLSRTVQSFYYVLFENATMNLNQVEMSYFLRKYKRLLLRITKASRHVRIILQLHRR